MKRPRKRTFHPLRTSIPPDKPRTIAPESMSATAARPWAQTARRKNVGNQSRSNQRQKRLGRAHHTRLRNIAQAHYSPLALLPISRVPQPRTCSPTRHNYPSDGLARHHVYGQTLPFNNPYSSDSIRDGRKQMITIPANSVVKVTGGPTGNDRLIDVLSDGRVVMMFTQDLQVRGEEIPDQSGNVIVRRRSSTTARLDRVPSRSLGIQSTLERPGL